MAGPWAQILAELLTSKLVLCLGQPTVSPLQT